MTIRKNARQWFENNVGVSEEKIFASRFYTSKEAWPKQDSWWFEISLECLRAQQNRNIHLLCQKSPNENDFYHLKIPAAYFINHLKDLTIQKSGRVSIFPSAEPDELFKDLRGKAKVNFSSFLL